MLIAQISDCHVVPTETEKGKLMQTKVHLETAVAHLLSLEPRPDAVLVSGDLVEDGAPTEYDLLIELLAPLKSQIPVYLAPGNHDDREVMRARMRAGGYGYLPESGNLQYGVDLGELRLLSLDTVIPGEAGGTLCDERLAWLDEQLARDARPTLIMQHHPPFSTGMVHMDGMGYSGAEREGAVIAKHSHVLRILCGHLHRSISTAFSGTIAMTAPSCAHAVELDLRPDGRLAVVREPPSVALHFWNQGTLISHTSFIGDYGPAHVIAE